MRPALSNAEYLQLSLNCYEIQQNGLATYTAIHYLADMNDK